MDAQTGDAKWELFDGRILAMTNPSLGHADIVANMAGALRPVMSADRRCRVMAGDVGVQMSDDDRGTYAPMPDVMVRCGATDGSRNFATMPMAIAEVPPPSIMDIDRRAKLRFYKTALQTLRQIT
jgi:Uma2 family endonuclease